MTDGWIEINVDDVLLIWDVWANLWGFLCQLIYPQILLVVFFFARKPLHESNPHSVV